MRIYGGRDFYDCGMALGRDPNVTLVRDCKPTYVTAKEAGFSLIPKSRLGIGLRNWRIPVDWKLQNIAVAFCSKVYYGALLMHHQKKDEGLWGPDRIYSFNAVEKKCWIGVQKSYYQKHALTPEQYMDVKDAPSVVRDYMIANRIAILVEEEPNAREEVTLRINPTGLKQLGFAKALDPYTAFQELSMWIGGILGGTSPEIVRITDDKVLIENHGYDKHSFRSSSRVA